MRSGLRLPVPVLLLALVSAGTARSDDRSLVILFGPTGEAAGGRQRIR
jgi:hypothetical protein